MISNYLKTRLKPLSFLALAFLLSLLLTKSNFAFDKLLFLFYSFLVFRLLDDAGSLTVDRLNKPERSYLTVSNYPKFLRLTLVNIIIYLVILVLFVSYIDALVISIFIIISISAYIYFNNSENAIAIIALLKYPLLMWSAQEWQSDEVSISLSFASFFLMATHDLLEKKDNVSYLLGLLFLVISACLVFQTWQSPYSIVHVIPVLLIALIFRKNTVSPIAPILIFSITYFLST